MKARNIRVTFHINVYDSRPWFNIPKAIAKLLEVKSGDVLAVTITRPNGQPLYHGLAKMASGREVYRSYVSKQLTKGEEIRVTVARPPKGTVRDVPQEN